MMNTNAVPRSVRPDDLQAVVALLKAAGLPTAGVDVHFDNFLVTEEAGRVTGAVGFELYGTDALFRSLVVEPRSRGRGLGRRLIDEVVLAAWRRGVRTAYLLTTTEQARFARFGFEVCARADVPPAVVNTAEFRSLCPASAVCMRLSLDQAGRGRTPGGS